MVLVVVKSGKAAKKYVGWYLRVIEMASKALGGHPGSGLGDIRPKNALQGDSSFVPTFAIAMD
jgi:hypothetical protein